ncbi:MAG: thioredoxin [Pseudomonadota bacterium]
MSVTDLSAPPADLIADASTETFGELVLAASQAQPVIVDFWAPWCGPCKQLTPLLEKAVTAAKGAVKLVKVNIDENQMIAQQMRIQSIPAVFAFVNGQPVDGFMGAVSESELKAFIERLGGGAGDRIGEALDAAEAALEGGDVAAAAETFSAVAQAEPENLRAIAGLARAFIAGDALDQAKAILEQTPAGKENDPAIAQARAALDLAELRANAGDLGDLKARAEANPDDFETRLELADAFTAHDMKEEAADELLAMIARDRAWGDEAARKKLLTLFEAFGPTDPVTIKARRRLSSILFA